MAAPLCPLCLERTCPEGKRLCHTCGAYDPEGYNRPLDLWPYDTELTQVSRDVWIRADKVADFERVKGGHIA